MAQTLSLLYDRVRVEEKEIINAAQKKGVELRPIDAKELHLKITDLNKDEIFGDVAIERCVSHFRGLYITSILENKGVTVINPFSVAALCGDKLLCSMKLAKAGIPTPKTIVAFTKEEAMKVLEEEMGYPAVIKPVFGSWGRLIAPLKDRETAQALLEDREEMGNPLYQIYYIQEMVERPPRDIRTVVVGDRIAASIYRYSAPDDWRTNIARGGKAEVCNLTEDLRALILKAAEVVGTGVLGVDAMETKEGIVIHEVNSTVEFKGAMSVSEVDIPGMIIDYALEKARK